MTFDYIARRHATGVVDYENVVPLPSRWHTDRHRPGIRRHGGRVRAPPEHGVTPAVMAVEVISDEMVARGVDVAAQVTRTRPARFSAVPGSPEYVGPHRPSSLPVLPGARRRVTSRRSLTGNGYTWARSPRDAGRMEERDTHDR
jgi:hypothetical protein